MVEKLYRDGKVAVLVSYGFGAGWFSWNGNEDLLFDKTLIEMIEKGQFVEAENRLKTVFADEDGERPIGAKAEDLDIAWVDIGEQFRIDEYDGSESLVLFKNQPWVMA